MRIAGAAGIFVANGVWRLTGLRAAGRIILRALGSGDETVRTPAQMEAIAKKYGLKFFKVDNAANSTNLPDLAC